MLLSTLACLAKIFVLLEMEFEICRLIFCRLSNPVDDENMYVP
jgi:hypothetical protein